MEKGEEMKEFKKIPENYQNAAQEAGILEKFNYIFQREGTDRLKEAIVYLPYAYKKENQYNILYLMHGGGGQPSDWFGTPENPTMLKNVMDHMIEDHLMNPLLIIMPTYRFPDDNPEGDMEIENRQTESFQEDFRNSLIVAVETHYSTYAEGVDHKFLENSREHRAFGGFSMGSAATWYCFLHSLDLVSRFVPMSGDCWKIEVKGGLKHPKETAQLLETVASKSISLEENFEIYMATGDRDIAYEAVDKMMNQLSKQSSFMFGKDFKRGNIIYHVSEGYEHDYRRGYEYLYNALPMIWSRL